MPLPSDFLPLNYGDEIPRYPDTFTELDFAIHRLGSWKAKLMEDWLSSTLAHELDPGIFLKAYGNDDCKKVVCDELKVMGFELAYFPCGKVELRRNNAVISTYDNR